MSRRQLLRSMDAREMQHWRAYEKVEPFLTERLNYHFAALQFVVLAALGGKRKDGRDFELKDLLLDWQSPYVEPEVTSLDPAEIERRIMAWVLASNASLGEKGTVQ
jgi:hypothetical protein